jgi:hypothetical protein
MPYVHFPSPALLNKAHRHKSEHTAHTYINTHLYVSGSRLCGQNIHAFQTRMGMDSSLSRRHWGQMVTVRVTVNGHGQGHS